MTKQEAVVIEVYTGIVMLTGEDRDFVSEYIEKLLGFPIMTHELLQYEEKLKELSKPDFIKICKGLEQTNVELKEKECEELFFVGLTLSQAKNLAQFLEFYFIESIKHDDDIDNINYLVDMCEAYKKLNEVVENSEVE